jgi:hypothetical protein
MKVQSVGWAFFVLAVVVMIGYLLNRGLFVGSDIRPAISMTSKGNRTEFRKSCTYLHFTGVSESVISTGDTSQEAAEGLCSMFDPFSN